MFSFSDKPKKVYINFIRGINIIRNKYITNNIENSKDSIDSIDMPNSDYLCCRCVAYKIKYIRHCNRCDDCHDNRKTLYCDLCNICINYLSEIDIISHRKRHSNRSLLEFRKNKRHNSI